jgi:hypothetical protein
MLSANFSAADLLQAGETWAETRITNIPVETDTWAGLKQLCEDILEPVQASLDALSSHMGLLRMH